MAFKHKILKNLRGKSGLYFFYDDDDNLLYIGKSTNLRKRICTSARERGLMRFRYIEIENKSDLAFLEVYFVAKYKPKYNGDFNYSDELTVACDYGDRYVLSEVYELEKEFVLDSEAHSGLIRTIAEEFAHKYCDPNQVVELNDIGIFHLCFKSIEEYFKRKLETEEEKHFK